MNHNLQTLKVVLLALVLAAGIQYASAQAPWRAPTASPPGDNTYAPINVGGNGQTKTGGITVGSALDSTQTGFNVQGGKFLLKGAAGTSGQVIKADGAGQAVWGADATGAGGGGVITFYNGSAHVGNYGVFNVRSDGPFFLQNSTIFSGAAELGMKPSYVIPQGCSTNQIPKWNGSAWTCQADNAGGIPSLGSSSWLYGSGDGIQQLTCPSGQVVTGLGLVDTNSGCQLGSGRTNCGMRVSSIRCAPLQ